MNAVFKKKFNDFNLTNDVYRDTYELLILNGCEVVAKHSLEVAEECKRLAKQFNVNTELAQTAGLLHDISAIFSNSERLKVASDLDLEILKEEKEFPLILHQKISKVMANDIWKIENEEILNAIECHTTLKENFSKLDLILFVADKIKWDQKGIPPYIDEVQKGLEISLEHGAFAYLKYIMENKARLKVIHPWLLKAYKELEFKISIGH